MAGWFGKDGSQVFVFVFGFWSLFACLPPSLRKLREQLSEALPGLQDTERREDARQAVGFSLACAPALWSCRGLCKIPLEGKQQS